MLLGRQWCASAPCAAREAAARATPRAPPRWEADAGGAIQRTGGNYRPPTRREAQTYGQALPGSLPLQPHG
eukprot:100462-Alexandrium_andersonii.AAC.1